ncbi:EAL domain-containing protein [Gracilibacillus massiliensis]|uniref:EAL domain-containing protein n=1 Tax=Gracilibacillus massiliensis TaxID=1564956 RepID=UPI00071C87E2|nr:EAL domain-containing protein [Gracilibacillus massiliensis]
MPTQQIYGVLSPILEGNYFGNILQSIRNEAKNNNIKVVIMGTKAEYYQHIYGQDFIDGWIIIMDAVDQNYVDQLIKLGNPVIGINTKLRCTDYVHVNNKDSIKQLFEHLLSHQYKKIAYIGDRHFYDATERYDAISEYLKHYGLKKGRWYYDVYHQTPEQVVKSITEQGIEHDALICVNDFIAYKVIHALKDKGISVPNDIAVVGFDNSYASKYSLPPLTTVQLPVQKIGKAALQKLIHYNSHQEFLSFSDSQIKGELIVRQSCNCMMPITYEEGADPSRTFNYLTNMVSRNYNLGQIMQSYKYHDIMKMEWLRFTPYNKGLIGLKTNAKEELNVIRFDINDSRQPSVVMDNMTFTEFPSKYFILDQLFMENENTVTVIPIIQDEKEIGAFLFVGLDDDNTVITPLNTTYQLVTFFSAALKRANMVEDLQNYSNKLELISDIMYDGIWEMDINSGIVTSNGGIHRILGFQKSNSAFSYFRLLKLIHPRDRREFQSKYEDHINNGKRFEVECRFKHREGHYIWMYITGKAERNVFGSIVKVLGSIMDISERKYQEERIKRLIYLDSLTQTYNRFYLEENLPMFIQNSTDQNKKLALIMFDLDRFKLVNDTYGHQAGDQLLKLVSQRVRDISSKNEMICRLGGDEFIIIMPYVTSLKDIKAYSERLRQVINAPFYQENIQFDVSASIGITIAPDLTVEAEKLILQADIAMYKAKTTGRNRIQLYNAQINEENFDKVDFENQLRNALGKEELTILFQPIYYSQTLEQAGKEILLRWHSEKYGEVMPGVFIPIAEETGLISEIGVWVMKEACRYTNQIEDNQKIFINISSQQLNHPDFIAQTKNILTYHNCIPEKLCLEITETAMLKNTEHSLKVLEELGQMGIQIAIDDFGTGYSSFSLLRDLPIQTLKIDRAFIQHITSNEKDLAIIKAIIELSHILQIDVVAEGVETEEQLRLLADLQVDFVQGFYLARPAPYHS